MLRIDACRNGDKEALAELYRTYAHRLLGVCRNYVKDADVAEDILHDAFIIIFMSIGDLKDDSKLEGWMVTIVKNLSLRYLQSTENNAVPLSYLDLEIQDGGCEERQSVDLGLLLSAIDSLPAGNREVFKLSVLDGLSHKEIGALLGIHPHSSSSQLFRAKKMLRTMLRDYWLLFLLPMLIPLYLYFIKRNREVGISDDKPTAADMRRNHTKKDRKAGGTPMERQPRYTVPAVTLGSVGLSPRDAGAVAQHRLPAGTDSVGGEYRSMTFHVDSLWRRMGSGIAMEDSLYRLPRLPEDKLMALNEIATPAVKPRKSYPWTFNFGYASNAGAGGTLSNLDYLSVVDYANGGAAAKLYTWNDYIDYMNRNAALMDSVERAKQYYIAENNMTDGNAGLNETAHHDRPKTFGLSLNKQLSPRWIFGTGLTYTKLKSEFVSEYNKAELRKVQKIDYVGVPLRLTYRLWSKGRLNAYATGGVTFEMPVHSSLSKNYIITADSSYTLKGNVKARNQWSVNFGVGVQYKVFKPFSLYLEPNMFYYFRNGSGLETYRTEHPFMLTVPFGLRITW